MLQPIVHSVFEPNTCSWQYVVACPKTKEAAIIDPVLDFEPAIFTVSTQSADRLLEIVHKHGYTVTRLLETHAHADHLTAAYYIQEILWARGHPHAPICIGENITIVQSFFAHRYNVPREELQNAFDILFRPDDQFQIGELVGIAMHLPGHTPDNSGYHFRGNIFTGDSIFHPDIGSARCDFPGGDARSLWRSLQRLLAFPPDTRLYTAHDYPPSNESAGRDPVPFITVGDQRTLNKHLKNGSTEEDFVAWRNQKDRVMTEPPLIHQALQINIRGGKMPGRSHKGKAMLNYLVNVPKTLLTG
ncbi:hypothetical protein N7512_004087 [Penicillium capsulatum]|nr:hypothetical protein N7512_004087 [Penicillium capsulatum]